MKKWFTNLDLYYRICIISFFLLIIESLILIPCYFTGWSEIPNGTMLGQLVAILTYLFIGLISAKDKEKDSVARTIIVMIIRFALIAATLILGAYLYYKKNYHIFNVFAILAGYLINLVVVIIMTLKEKKDV